MKAQLEEYDSLVEIIRDAAEAIKAVDIDVYDVSGRSSIVDYFVICSGTSTVHINSIVKKISGELKQNGIAFSVEGTQKSRWIAIDTGPVIVHVMGTEERQKYNLEEMWKHSAIIYHH